MGSQIISGEIIIDETISNFPHEFLSCAINDCVDPIIRFFLYAPCSNS